MKSRLWGILSSIKSLWKVTNMLILWHMHPVNSVNSILIHHLCYLRICYEHKLLDYKARDMRVGVSVNFFSHRDASIRIIKTIYTKFTFSTLSQSSCELMHLGKIFIFPACCISNSTRETLWRVSLAIKKYRLIQISRSNFKILVYMKFERKSESVFFVIE